MTQQESLDRFASYRKAIALWLFLCCVVVFGMIVLGGVTRLTRSGLSMVEWRPLLGTLPPLTQKEWNRVFSLYKKFPEYKKVNKGMTLPQFKKIFYVEWGHRLVGRTIGILFFLPFLFFLIRKAVPKPLLWKLLLMLLLGGSQGLMGWYMVKSGLVNKPSVSQYRLTAHLALACIIYIYMFWVALGLWFGRREEAEGSLSSEAMGLKRWAFGITATICVMILSGGFVAGTKAGFAYNTFPKMAGQWIPSGMYSLAPWYRNWFENLATVQFNHRMIAYLLCILIPLLWWQLQKASVSSTLQRAGHFLLGAVALQVTLGITTLLWKVPVPLAAAHQGGAIVLLTAALSVNYILSHREHALSTTSSAPA